ncbi:hypothetical protein QSU92_09915 [Microbacterium sp. ET2]|nr:hypothetical protein [Microbacterium sp. ET2 (Ac-2212)]WJL94309.1 hypothetical protein QSU92_09915 [Microbacterium sp. ET2 (Ac-2212)]
MIEEVASLLKAQYPHVVGESTEEIVTNVAIAHAERSASPPRPGNG